MSRWVLIAAEVVLLAAAAWQGWDVAVAMAARFGSPFDLEWMEGATLITGLRSAEGLPFYTLPSPDYIPFIYPPLYAWLLGALSAFWPVGYALGRGVSIACTGIAVAALYFAARREGVRPALAVGCAMLFVGCYEDGGTFYDLVRTDALAIALVGLALAVSRGETRAHAVAGGLLLFVAFCAKQHAAMFGFPIVLALARRDGWRRAALFAAASAVPALAFVVAMQIHTNGLFLTYLLEVPSHHGMVADRLLPNIGAKGRLEGAQAEVWRALPWTTTLGLLALARWPARLYWGGVALTALVTVSLMRGHQGGYLNVLIPMFWVQALFPALLERALARGPSIAARFGPHAVTLLVAFQLWDGRQSLARYVPSPGDAARAERLVEELRALPEPMLIPHAPWLAVLAGKKPSFALITLWDVDHRGGPLARELKPIREAMAAHYWRTIVTPDAKLGMGLLDHYAPGPPLNTDVVPTRTGWGVRLKRTWVPMPDDPGIVKDDPTPERED